MRRILMNIALVILTAACSTEYRYEYSFSKPFVSNVTVDAVTEKSAILSGTVYRYNAGRNVWDQVMTEDLTAGANAQSGDPLRGLVAEDILTRFRAAQPVIRNNGVREEAYRLGVWVRDSIGMDRLPSAVSAMGKRIGQKYEFWIGTDISNNLDSNFPKIYEAYFTLKDYYTSGGSVPFYEEVSDENDYFGNGDPETIRMMYKDMQEFITACNNTIRKK